MYKFPQFADLIFIIFSKHVIFFFFFCDWRHSKTRSAFFRSRSRRRVGEPLPTCRRGWKFMSCSISWLIYTWLQTERCLMNNTSATQTAEGRWAKSTWTQKVLATVGNATRRTSRHKIAPQKEDLTSSSISCQMGNQSILGVNTTLGVYPSPLQILYLQGRKHFAAEWQKKAIKSLVLIEEFSIRVCESVSLPFACEH